MKVEKKIEPYLYHIQDIYISEPEWAKIDSILKVHRTYQIKTTWKNKDNSIIEVSRRYSHFEALRNALAEKYPDLAIPVLPGKGYYDKLLGDQSEFLIERRRKLDHFFTLIMSHPILKVSKEVRYFLTEKDSVYDHNFKSFKEEASNEQKTSWTGMFKQKLTSLYNSAKIYGLNQIFGTSIKGAYKDEDSGSTQKLIDMEDLLKKLKYNFEAIFKYLSERIQSESKQAEYLKELGCL